MKPHPKNGFQIKVGEDQVFLELFPPGDQPALLIEDHAPPIEDQFILAADEVAESDDGQIVGGPGRDHSFTKGRFPGMVGGGRDIDDQFRPAVKGLGANRVSRIPQIFTDAQSDRNGLEEENEVLLAPASRYAIFS